MGYRLVFRRRAARELDELPQPIRGRIMRAVAALAMQPRPPGAALLSGPERIWRVRVGDYRVLYRVDDDVLLVLVIRVRHRSGMYR